MEFKHFLLIISFMICLLSQAQQVKADMLENIASIILFILITTFICAGIGWWHKRSETKY